MSVALWEQLAGVEISLGRLALFSGICNIESPNSRWLSERCFGVYVLHAATIIALALLFRTLPKNIYALVALLILTGFGFSFIMADIARRLPSLCSIFVSAIHLALYT